MLSEFARLELQAVLAVYRKQESSASEDAGVAASGGNTEIREIEAALAEHRARSDEYARELDPRFVQLSIACGLSPVERDILLLALVPAWHTEFESILAALAEREYRGLTPDIITRIFAEQGDTELAAHYQNALYLALAPDAALLRFRLIRFVDPGEPLFGTRLAVDPRILLFLQGSDDMPAGLTRCLRPIAGAQTIAELPIASETIVELEHVRGLLIHSEERLAFEAKASTKAGSENSSVDSSPESAKPGRPLIQLYGPAGNGKRRTAVALANAIERPLLHLDAVEFLSSIEVASAGLTVAGSGGSGLSISGGATGARSVEDRAALLRELTRETLLYGAVLLITDWHLLVDHPAGRELLAREFEYLAGPLLLTSAHRCDINLPDHSGYLAIQLPLPDAALRRSLWQREAERYTGSDATGESNQVSEGKDSEAKDRETNDTRRVVLDDSVAFDFLASGFRFTEKQIRGAFRRAYTRSLAFSEGRINQQDLLTGCYSESNRGLNQLAVQVRSRPRWDSLILRPEPLRQLTELCNQAKYSAEVYQSWGFSPGSTGQGLHALFVGAPGTGKTMAASVVATELGLELYRIDLSSIVSKYIGETEKNLSRIFLEAETSNAVLFFDEADALFGKRGEVKDAQDRYANMEVSYLLQKMEEFPGITILATNFRANLDKAFVRRLHFIVDFPFPDATERMGIWELNFPKQAPLSRDVDLAFLAARLDVPGALIKNIARNAAFLAVSEQSSISLRHIRRAAAREYQKDNRPVPDFSAELH